MGQLPFWHGREPSQNFECNFVFLFSEGPHVWWKDEHADLSGEVTKKVRYSYSKWTAPPGAVRSVRARDPRLCMTQIQKLMTEGRDYQLIYY